MKTALATKVYKFDFKFILNNYLDERLWKKEWCIFDYNNIKVMIKLKQINVEDGYIDLKVYIQNGGKWDYSGLTIWLNEAHFNEQVYLKSLITCVINRFKYLELLEIIGTDGYKQAKYAEDTYNGQLEEVANDFLDENGVTNKDIREAYVDSYVSKNGKDYSSSYVNSRYYSILTDLYLAYLAYVGDEDKFKEVAQFSFASEEKQNEINAEIEEMKTRLEEDDLIAEMQESLEAI